MSESGIQEAVCFKHTGRESHIRCNRCNRYICPDCMREAAVGFQCPECVKEGNKSIREARSVFGGKLSTDSSPYVTLALIMLNVAVYIGELQNKALESNWAVMGRGLVGPDGGRYVWQPGPYPPGFHVIGIAHGESYRLFTGMFVHLGPAEGTFGILHILMNMLALWQLGPFLEHFLGRARFLALYLVSGLGSSTLVYVLAPDRGAIGASGAIFGLAAAFFLVTRRTRVNVAGGNDVLIRSVIWMVIASQITSWQGHLGGFLVGGIVGAAIIYAPRVKQTFYQAAAILGAVALLAVAVNAETARLKAADVPPYVPTIVNSQANPDSSS